jgi:hypothetical protein
MILLIIMFGLFYALNAANHIEKADTVKSENTISVVNPVGPYIEFILPFLLKEFNHKILTLLFHYP